ncbi:MAG: carbon-nitrogen hydrolase family protein, partial [Candidatus Bathyarchaeia archaeon]
MNVELVAVQLQPGSGSIKDIVAKAADHCLLVKAEPDIMCLPEAWIWKNSVMPGHELRNVYSLAVEAFTRVATELGTYVALGGIPSSTANGDFVSSPVIDPSGNVVGEQLKTHLFRGEKTRFQPGTTLEIFKMGDLNVGILVCHDIVFPE